MRSPSVLLRFLSQVVSGWFVLFSMSLGHAAGEEPPSKTKVARNRLVQMCVDAHTNGQSLRASEKLLAATKQFEMCAQKECPEIAQQDCAQWLGEVRKDIPSFIVGARYPDGRDAVDGQVSVDSNPDAQLLMGEAIELDPGVHTVRVTVKGLPPVEQTVVARVGERNRRVILALRQPRRKLPPPKERDETPLASYALMGVGAAGLVGFTYFALSGLSMESDLDGCKPVCPPEDVSAVRTRYVLADVSLAIGLVATGAGSYLFFNRAAHPPREQARVAEVRISGGQNALGASVEGSF